MVKKIKVVDVAQPEEATVNQPIEEVKEEVTEAVKEEAQPIEDKVEEAVVEVEEKKPKRTVSEKNVTCEFCKKEMLMKTYKYNHKKLCELKHTPPPPPPTPEPEPKKRVKREPKPKEVKPIEEKQPEAPQTSQFSGVVSFNDFPRVEDPYQTMRQQRLLVRQQRVKSLISQAV
jgi:hypothetical protein